MKEILSYLNSIKTINNKLLENKEFYPNLLGLFTNSNYNNLIEFCYYLKTNDSGKCQYPNCANKTKFISFKRGYRNGCCFDHTNRLNNLVKYGFENVMQVKEIHQKFTNSMQSTYGCSHALQNIDILNNMLLTQNQNGGVGASNPQTLEKMKSTNLIKFGFENSMQSETVQIKFKNTMNNIYGVPHALQNRDLNEKRIETNISKYGVNHHSQSDKLTKETRLRFITRKIETLQLYITPLFDITRYENIDQQLEWLCTSCKTNFISNLDNGIIPRCPKCNPKMNVGYSKIEKLLIVVLNDLGCIIQNSRIILKGQEIDIYFPEYKLAIEVNGIYWHSEQKGKDKNYHLFKTLGCYEQNINLIHVTDHECSIDLSKVEMLVKKYLMPPVYKLSNRVEICEISSQVLSEFLQQHTFKEKNNYYQQFGLYDDSELVAVLMVNELNQIQIIELLDYKIVNLVYIFLDYCRNIFLGQIDIIIEMKYNMLLDYTSLGCSMIGIGLPQFYNYGGSTYWDDGYFIMRMTF